MSDTITPREVAIQWFQEVWGERNAESVTRLMAPHAKAHLEGGVEMVGPAEFLSLHKSLLTIFPDLDLKVLRVIGSETDACVHWEITGTHQGDAMGFAPTGKPHAFDGITWLRIENGQIVEGWDRWNQNDLFTKLANAPAAQPNREPA